MDFRSVTMVEASTILPRELANSLLTAGMKILLREFSMAGGWQVFLGAARSKADRNRLDW